MSARTRTLLQMAAVFVACTAIFHWMLARQPYVLDVDGMYHYKVATLIREHGPWVDISWLPFTVLGQHGTDHEWLFHAILAPFTLLGSDLDSLQWVAAMAGAAVPTALIPILTGAGVPFPLLFSLLAAASTQLLPGRFLTLRTENIAVIFMAAALFAFARRRSVAIGVIAFLFMQSYHGVVILGPMAVIALGVQALRERRVSLRPLVALAVGVFAGLVASPWFPANVRYLVFHTFFKAAIGVPGLEGTEWLHVSALGMLRESWVAHLLVVTGLVAAALAARRAGRLELGEDTLASMALVVLLLAMYHFAWRFAEYYGPFAAVCSALLWRDALRAGRGAPVPAPPPLGVALAVLVAVGMYLGNSLIQSGKRANPVRFDAFRDMIEYVEAHDPKPMIFNTSWSDFQQMVFWAHSARFVAGLDGHFLLYGDPERFKIWYAIQSGRIAQGTDNARLIRDTFGARWVIISRGFPKTVAGLRNDPAARLVMVRPEGWLVDLQPRP